MNVTEDQLQANREMLSEMALRIGELQSGERELKALCRTAADALEKYTDYLHMVMSATLQKSSTEIIAQLRKAAE